MLGVAALLVLCFATVATWQPARRATQVDARDALAAE